MLQSCIKASSCDTRYLWAKCIITRRKWATGNPKDVAQRNSLYDAYHQGVRAKGATSVSHKHKGKVAALQCTIR